VFQLGRAFDQGNGVTDDPGQLVGRSDGTKVWVYVRGQRVRRYTFNLTGLTTLEWYALNAYIQDVLTDTLEPFTLQHGPGYNLLSNSTSLTGWAKTGTNPPTVSSAVSTTGPHGQSVTADRVTYPGAFSAQQIVDTNALAGVATGASLFVHFMARIDSGDIWKPEVNDHAGEALPTVAADGAWHRITNVYTKDAGSDNFELGVQFATLGLAPVVFLTDLMVIEGQGPKRYAASPPPSSSSMRLERRPVGVPVRDDSWSVTLAMRQEVAPP